MYNVLAQRDTGLVTAYISSQHSIQSTTLRKIALVGSTGIISHPVSYAHAPLKPFAPSCKWPATLPALTLSRKIRSHTHTADSDTS